MKIIRYYSIIILGCLFFVSGVFSQQYIPSQTYYGRNYYIEYHAGDLPLIFSAPHGGSMAPEEIPDRTYGTTGADVNTKETALAIRDAVLNYTGHYPHIIISNLKRLKLDPNREIVEAAQGNPWAEQAWNEYHGFIEIAEDTVTANFGKGLYVDIHGHGHAIQRLELGYLLSASTLSKTDEQLNSSTYINSSSLRALAMEASVSFAELLRGPKSLGTLFEEKGIPAVPSLNQPNPGSGNPYFIGGYSTRKHGSRDSGTVSGVQIEAYRVGLRDTPENRMRYAQVITEVFDEFFRAHFGWEGMVTHVENNNAVVPNELLLEQNYPNPFNSSTSIIYSLAKPDYATIRIYNLLGQELKTILNGFQTAGLHEIRWSAEGLPSGIYFYKLQSGGFSKTRKLIIQK